MLWLEMACSALPTMQKRRPPATVAFATTHGRDVWEWAAGTEDATQSIDW
jgi:hypothetical protein